MIHLRDFKKEELDHLKEISAKQIGFILMARYIFSVDSMKISLRLVQITQSVSLQKIQRMKSKII